MPRKVNLDLFQTEHDLQVAVFQWRAVNVYRWPELAWLHAVPNQAARKIVSEGVTRGVYDVCWPIARRGYFGLYIELKRPGKLKNVSPEQVLFGEFLEIENYWNSAMDNFDAVVWALEWYVSGARTVAVNE